MKSRFFTIYNCGTMAKRDDFNELIADMAARTDGDEVYNPADFVGEAQPGSYRYWMINDGPGSQASFKTKVKRALGMKVGNAVRTPGTFNVVTGKRTALDPDFVKAISGSIWGEGWRDNVRRAMMSIYALDPKPQVINMAGWSRGAVICHMIAHEIQQMYGPQMEVNIFAADPVPGGSWSFEEPDKALPPCVKNYLAILAANDQKLFFDPVVPPRAAGSNSSVIVLPGIHDTAVQGAAGLSGVPVLTQHLADQFMLAHGTPLRRPIHLEDREISEHYAKIRRNLRHYKALVGRDMLALRGHFTKPRRSITENRRCYFINEHHLACFERAFPGVYRGYFSTDSAMNREFGAAALQGVQQDLERMRLTCPNSYAQLRDSGVAPELGPDAMPLPAAGVPLS